MTQHVTSFAYDLVLSLNSSYRLRECLPAIERSLGERKLLAVTLNHRFYNIDEKNFIKGSIEAHNLDHIMFSMRPSSQRLLADCEGFDVGKFRDLAQIVFVLQTMGRYDIPAGIVESDYLDVGDENSIRVAQIEGQIEALRHALSYHELFDEEAKANLDALLARVRNERLTIAFVAEIGRGKSELINALFFSERGKHLLPSGPGRSTLCVTELRHDHDWPPCVRLLPIETRESPSRFAELVADKTLWKTIAFNYDDSDSIMRALESLGETRRVPLGEAVAWGLHGDAVSKPVTGSAAQIDVPRWRHAIINLPHPLLQAGLVVLDTPGLTSLAAEPELSRHRIPEADCVVFILDAKEGVTKPDLAIWKDYLGRDAMKFSSALGRGPEVAPLNRLVVLNKIDCLSVLDRSDSDTLREIDRLVKNAADLLRVDPIRVIPLSAHLGLAGKITGDRDRLIRSRLYQLERGVTSELSSARQISLSSEAQCILSDILAAARAKIDESRFTLLGQVRELRELREKNQRLVGNLTQKASTQQDCVKNAVKDMRGLRAVHARLGEELAGIVSVDQSRRQSKDTAEVIASSLLSGGIQTAMNLFIKESRQRILLLEQKVDEIKGMFSEIFDKMKVNYGISVGEILPFTTQRFHTELQKAESEAVEEFNRPANLLLRRGPSLGMLFQEVVGNRVIRIFEIAARESSLWMQGLLAELEKPLENLGENAMQRAEGMEKLHNAEIELAEKISELQAQLDIIRSRHNAILGCSASLDRHFSESDNKDVA